MAALILIVALFAGVGVSIYIAIRQISMRSPQSSGVVQHSSSTPAIQSPITTTSKVGRPFIGSISPASGPVGTKVTLTGSGFAPLYIQVNFNPASKDSDGVGMNPVVSSNGDSVTFIVPSASRMPDCTAGVHCSSPTTFGPGLYTVSVGNYQDGISNVVHFTMTGF